MGKRIQKPCPGIYQHYKGPYYEVIGVGKHTETEQELVSYYDEKGNLWIRPKAMFLGKVHGKPRFKLVDKQGPIIGRNLPMYLAVQDLIKSCNKKDLQKFLEKKEKHLKKIK